MKPLILGMFLCAAARGATYYVASASSMPAGSDSNNGAQGTPWKSVQHAVNNMACGDTLIVVADGKYADGDANFPYFPNCSTYTTIKSSLLSLFNPVGYRVSPTDDATKFGKLSFANQGFYLAPNIYNWNVFFQGEQAGISVDVPTGQLTITGANGMRGLANGLQVVCTPNSYNSGNNNGGWPTPTCPSPLNADQKYYVVNCSVSPACGTQNSTFFLSATSGGSPIALTTNGIAVSFMVSVGVDPTTGIFTLPFNWGTRTLANDIPVAFSSTSLQSLGSLPGGLNGDQTYYTVNVSGTTFQISTVKGGASISSFSNVGTGMLNMANTDVPNFWRFSGLEMKPVALGNPHYFFEFGASSQTTASIGIAHHFDVDRVYAHDNPADNTDSVNHNIVDNGSFVYVHDSWISNGCSSECQAISGTYSPGPTWITNNYLAAPGEVSLFGGDWAAYAAPNNNVNFIGNYIHKPPAWKRTIWSGAASGPCFGPDGINPDWPGGEWYRDNVGNQTYQCNGSNVWAAVADPMPRALQIKNMTEHKNGRNFLYFGNTYNNSFCGAQQCSVFNNSMEYSSGPGMADDHITATTNKILNSFQLMTTANQCFDGLGVCPIHPTNQVVQNTLMVINELACGVSFVHASCQSQAIQSGAPGQAPITILSGTGVNTGPQFDTFIWDHMTFWISDTFPAAFNALTINAASPNGNCPPYTPPPNTHVIVSNSLLPADFNGQCEAPGTQVFTDFYVNSAFTNIAVKGSSATYASAGSNTVTNLVKPANNSVIKFLADYSLDPTNTTGSPYSAGNSSNTLLSTDGTDLGADIPRIAQATSGSAGGTPTWDKQAGLQVIAGSTQAVFRYTAPTKDACTLTIYNTPVRDLSGGGNIVFTGADSAGTSISDSTRRELLATSLTAPTHYWYGLACGGGVLMVDPNGFWTKPTGTAAVPWQLTYASPITLKVCTDAAMSAGCSTPSSSAAVSVPAGGVRYVSPNPSATVSQAVSILVAP